MRMVSQIKKLISVRSAPARVLCAAVLCVLGLFPNVSIKKDVSSWVRISQKDSAQPTPQDGKLLIRDESFSQEIRTDSPKYFDLTVNRYGIGVTVQLVSADKTVLVSKPSRGVMYGPLRLNWKIQPNRVYFIRISADTQTTESGGFTLSINTRPLTQQD